MVVRDSAERRTYEVVVSLTERRVVSLEHVPEAQTALTEQDFLDAERLLKEDDRWQEAMRKRGVTDFEHVMIDPWPAAYLTDEDAPTRRLNRPLTFVRRSDGENGYAHPVEGLVALVDLDRGEVLEVVDHGVVDIPPAAGEYTTQACGGAQHPALCPTPHGPQAAGDHPAGGPELHGRRLRSALAEVAVPRRLHAARGTGPAHRRLGGPRCPAADPASRVDVGDGRAVRRSGADTRAQEHLRRRRGRPRRWSTG